MGGLGALCTSYILSKKPDLSMVVNGLLGGLVASTASCPYVHLVSANIIGFIAGCLVVISILYMDKVFRIDDPVGAISVHAVGGIWGALALGLFSAPTQFDYHNIPYPAPGVFFGGSFDQLFCQLIGVLCITLWAFTASFWIWAILKYTVGVRVSQKVEVDGLDIGEHGMEAYPGFVGSGESI